MTVMWCPPPTQPPFQCREPQKLMWIRKFKISEKMARDIRFEPPDSEKNAKLLNSHYWLQNVLKGVLRSPSSTGRKLLNS